MTTTVATETDLLVAARDAGEIDPEVADCLIRITNRLEILESLLAGTKGMVGTK